MDSDSAPPDSGVELLPTRPGEAPELAELAARIWRKTYRDLIPEAQIEYMLEWMYSPPTLEREMQEDSVEYFWIMDCGERTGFLAAGPVRAATACPLHKLYLLPEVQGRGLGSAAMRLILTLLEASGVIAVELRVNRNNAEAIAFYRKNGFEVYAENCREIGGGFVMDDFLMRRSLGDSE